MTPQLDNNAPQSKFALAGKYSFEHIRDGVVIDAWEDSNLIPLEGINGVLGVGFHAAAQQTAWYMGIGSGNYTADATDTGANIAARVTEITTYAGNRPQVVFGAPAAGSISNSASKVTFTFSAPVATVTNLFIVSAATGNAGLITSSLKLATAKTGFGAGDVLLTTYTLSGTSV